MGSSKYAFINAPTSLAWNVIHVRAFSIPARELCRASCCCKRLPLDRPSLVSHLYVAVAAMVATSIKSSTVTRETPVFLLPIPNCIFCLLVSGAVARRRDNHFHMSRFTIAFNIQNYFERFNILFIGFMRLRFKAIEVIT